MVKLGTIQWILISLSDVTSAVYALIFAIAVLFAAEQWHAPVTTTPTYQPTASPTSSFTETVTPKPTATLNFLISDLRGAEMLFLWIWLGAEVLSLVTTLVQRTFSFCKYRTSDGTLFEKLMLFKIAGFFQYFLVIMSTTGFVLFFILNSEDLQSALPGKMNASEYRIYEIQVISLSILIGLVVFVVLFVLIIPALTVMFVRSKGWVSLKLPKQHGEPNIFDIVIFAVQLPFYLLWNLVIIATDMTEGASCLAYPLIMLANIISIPIMIAAYVLGLLFSLFGCACLMIPCGIAFLFLPKKLRELLQQVASRLYTRLDKLVFIGYMTSLYTFVAILFGGLVACAWASYMIRPLTLDAVTDTLAAHNKYYTYGWIVAKCIQFAVSVMLPFLRLYAHGKLKALNILLGLEIEFYFRLIIIAQAEMLCLIFRKVVASLSPSNASDARDIQDCNEKLTEWEKELAEERVSIAALLQAIAPLIAELQGMLLDYAWDDSDKAAEEAGDVTAGAVGGLAMQDTYSVAQNMS